MARVCATCGETLPPSAFYATGYQRSCKACVARGKRRSARRSRLRARNRQREALRRALAITVRGVREVGHDDRCIVWEPGPAGLCVYVTVDHCPCDTFAAHGDCAHRRKAIELLGVAQERRVA